MDPWSRVSIWFPLQFCRIIFHVFFSCHFWPVLKLTLLRFQFFISFRLPVFFLALALFYWPLVASNPICDWAYPTQTAAAAAVVYYTYTYNSSTRLIQVWFVSWAVDEESSPMYFWRGLAGKRRCQNQIFFVVVLGENDSDSAEIYFRSRASAWRKRKKKNRVKKEGELGFNYRRPDTGEMAQ